MDLPSHDRRVSEDLALILQRNKGKKRVGFTPDTAPSSPVSPPQSYKLEPSGIDSDREINIIPNFDQPIPPLSIAGNVDNLTRPRPVLRQSSHPKEEDVQIAINTENSPSKSRENQSGKQARDRAATLAQSLSKPRTYSSSETQTTLPADGLHARHFETQAVGTQAGGEADGGPGDYDTESDDEPSLSELRRANDLQYNQMTSSFRPGILASKLGLWDSIFHSRNASVESLTPQPSPFPSGSSTPTPSGSRSPFSGLGRSGLGRRMMSSAFSSSSTLAVDSPSEFGEELKERLEEHARRPKSKRQGSAFSRTLKRISKHAHSDSPRQSRKVRDHIRDMKSRQKYLVILCRALMTYGAPTHRLEDYLRKSAETLEIEAQVMYIPGCMIISFDDQLTHTSDVRVIRCPKQAVSLSKLEDIHETYKDVVHDKIDVNEGNQRLKNVMKRKPLRSTWQLIVLYGLASVAVGPFAFQAGWVDLGPLFFLGALVGTLQQFVVPRSESYRQVFEVTATFLVALISRALGSINRSGQSDRIFCFSALTQSAIALILPGYTILCAALELQSQSVIAGSVRMVYAIIYTLFLGFGITCGTVLYGVFDKNASSETVCPAGHPIPQEIQFLFVIMFTMMLILINQGRLRQMPVMVTIGFVGFLVTHYGSQELVKGNTPLGTMMGAAAIGVMANAYARMMSSGKLRAAWERIKVFCRGRRANFNEYWLRRQYDLEDAASSGRPVFDGKPGFDGKPSLPAHDNKKTNPYGLAAVMMLPAIFVQVPSGLAITGSLVSGVASADSIIRNGTAANTTLAATSTEGLGSVAFNVSYSVIQIAIGITIGLSMSVLLVWPAGKEGRRSGLLTL